MTSLSLFSEKAPAAAPWHGVAVAGIVTGTLLSMAGTAQAAGPGMVFSAEAYAMTPGTYDVKQWAEWRVLRDERLGVFQTEVTAGLVPGLQLMVRPAELELSRDDSGRRAVRFNESAVELTWEMVTGGDAEKGEATWALSFVPSAGAGDEHLMGSPLLVGQVDWDRWEFIANAGFVASWSGARLSSLHADPVALVSSLGATRKLTDWFSLGAEVTTQTEWPDYEKLVATHVAAGPCAYFSLESAYLVIGYQRALTRVSHQPRDLLRVGVGVEF